jgi:D-threonate/D-erythronate kinase
MISLKLLADDLTGALDTSAELVGLFGPLSVVWSADANPAAQDRCARVAIDSGTRECRADEAFAAVQALAPRLAGAGIAYKKIDSLLRGPWVAELDACLRAGLWDACIVAPAFPHQGRLTRASRQFARTPDGSWSPVGNSIVEQFSERGLDARSADPDAALQSGVSVFDAETEGDLDRIVQAGRRYRGRLLWCGSGGLAGALARGTEVGASARLNAPVLGVFGSDHPATAAQLAVCGDLVIRTADIGPSLDRIRQALDDGVALVQLQTPVAASRAEAAQHFKQAILRLSQSIEAPRTLLVAGGETLKAQCIAVGAGALLVSGRLEPGVPRSMIQGGAWTGVDVISKSGAFGPPDLWRKLLRQNGLI